MKHKAASRFDPKYELNKCPQCKVIRRNFILVSDGMLGCSDCGCVFIAKRVREDFKLHLKEILEAQDQAITGFKCEVCGKVCKSKLGLGSHMRSHDNAADGS